MSTALAVWWSGLPPAVPETAARQRWALRLVCVSRLSERIGADAEQTPRSAASAGGHFVPISANHGVLRIVELSYSLTVSESDANRLVKTEVYVLLV